ncbi:MAG: hypothetical protein IPO81_12740 [Kouleothrix sp.]|nr:hypothetical protein [Kouleothrix sp.]
MPLDQATIAQQQKLLADHRQRLALLLEQQAKFGVSTPPHVVIDIREAQAAIRAIKAALREGGSEIADAPNDDAPPATAPAAPPSTPPVQQSVTAEGGGADAGLCRF